MRSSIKTRDLRINEILERSYVALSKTGVIALCLGKEGIHHLPHHNRVCYRLKQIFVERLLQSAGLGGSQSLR